MKHQLSEETLVLATNYLKTIDHPEGMLTIQEGHYLWESPNGSRKYLPNVVLSFAEKMLRKMGTPLDYISLAVPPGLTPKLEVAACYIYDGDQVLFMERPATAKSEPSLWGIPGGKVETGERLEEAVHREIFEETGIHFEREFPHHALRQLPSVYVTLPGGFCFTFHSFEIKLPKRPKVILSQQHTDYVWITLQQALEKYPLIRGEDECILLKLREN